MCSRCGQRPPQEGKNYCEKCFQYYRTRWINRTPEQDKIHKESVVNWRKKNPEKAKAIYKRYRDKIRVEVIGHYGGKCVCCGEDRIEFLNIDHINGGGNAHRKKVMGFNAAGWPFYRWLRKNNYPEGFQVLCWNCNMAKAHFGICPHQRE